MAPIERGGAQPAPVVKAALDKRALRKVVQLRLPWPGKMTDCLVGSGPPQTWFGTLPVTLSISCADLGMVFNISEIHLEKENNSYLIFSSMDERT